MKIINAYYPKSFPAHIIIETENGFFLTRLAPFRKIKSTDLRKLVSWNPIMGDLMPDYVLSCYGLEREY